MYKTAYRELSLTDRITENFNIIKQNNNEIQAHCPACNKDRLYLSIEGNKILVDCKHGCELTDIADALGVKQDFFFLNDNTNHKPKDNGSSIGHIAHIAKGITPTAQTAEQATSLPSEPLSIISDNKKQKAYTLDFLIKEYKIFEKGREVPCKFDRLHEYRNQNGVLKAVKVFWKPKQGKKVGRWFTPKGTKKGEITFISGFLDSTRIPLYKIKNVIEEDNIVVFVEGEKDADTIYKLDMTGTTVGNSFDGARADIKSNIKAVTNKNIVIIKDNDITGTEKQENLAEKLILFAKTVKLIDPLDIYPELKEKGDITDIVEALGAEETKKRLLQLIESTEPLQATKPPYIMTELDQYGNIKKYNVNEKLFITYYSAKNELYCLNDTFYNKTGDIIEDGIIKKDILKKIENYIVKGQAKKVNDLFNALAIACYIPEPKIKENVINCKNTSLSIDFKTAEISETNNSDFILNKINADYLQTADEPTKWISFLQDLLEPTDILTLQEYLGYCLVPTTRGQTALFIIGSGGEGKSRIGYIMQKLFNNSFISDKLHQLEDNKFMLARLENKLLFYEDDLNSQKLKETGTFKTVVTADTKVEVEKKGKDKYSTKLYTRFLAMGNQAISSCFDKTDGFYRRLLIMSCKRKDREKDDRNLNDKLESELNLIFYWCLKGLQRLILNGFNFTVSEKSIQNREELIRDDNSIIEFLEDTDFLEYNKTAEISSKDFTTAYALWCEQNSLIALSQYTFTRFLKANADKYNIDYKNRTTKTRVRGFKGVKLSLVAENLLQGYYNQEPHYKLNK